VSGFGAERLYRDYIGTDGEEITVEVDREPEVITTKLRARKGQDFEVGALYNYGDGKYRMTAHTPGGKSTLSEVCPGPFCHAPVTHRSLHDIPSGKFENWSDEARARWAEVGR
jgi:hypothetical protein